MKQSPILLALVALTVLPAGRVAASPLLQSPPGGIVITTEYAPGTQAATDAFLAEAVSSDWLVPEGSPAHYELRIITSSIEDRQCSYTLPGGQQVIYILNTMRLQVEATITDLKTGKQLDSRTFGGHSFNCPQTLVNQTGFDPVSGTKTVYGEMPPDDFINWLQLIIALAAQPDIAMMLTGHTGLVWQVLFSPDGQNILTMGDDQTVRIWDAQTGQQLRQVGSLGLVSSVAYSPDGSLVVTGNSNGEVAVWTASVVETARVFQTASDDQWGDQVNAVAFSPDGTRIAAGGHNNRVEVWELESETKQLDLQGHSGTIISVAFSPDGKSILTASDDTTVRIWDALTGEERLQFTGHEDELDEAHFSPDGQHVLSLGWDDTLLVWDAVTGSVLFQIAEDDSFFSPARACYTPDGQSILTVETYPDTLWTLWDAQTGERVRQFGSLAGVPVVVVRALSISPDGEYIAVAVAELVVIVPIP